MLGQDKFHWAGRVSRRDIQRLYESDARGLLDEELLELATKPPVHWRRKGAGLNQGVQSSDDWVDWIRLASLSRFLYYARRHGLDAFLLFVLFLLSFFLIFRALVSHKYLL